MIQYFLIYLIISAFVFTLHYKFFPMEELSDSAQEHPWAARSLIGLMWPYVVILIIYGLFVKMSKPND